MLNQLQLSEVSDQLRVMKLQEETSYACQDYISNFARNQMLGLDDNLLVITDECRAVMCDWCYQVVKFCKFQKDIVTVAFGYLDRYLCTKEGKNAICDTSEYQLAAMTSLYVAVKVHETVAIEPSLLCQLSRGAYCEQDFEQMEVRILNALGWKVNGPTPLSFLRCFMDLIPASVDASIKTEIMGLAQQEVELAVYDYNLFVTSRPSSIALTAIVNIMNDIDETVISWNTKKLFVTTIEENLGLHVDDHSFSCPLMDTEVETTIAWQVDNRTSSQKTPTHPISPTSVAREGLRMVSE